MQVCKALAQRPPLSRLHGTWMLRVLAGAGAAVNILGLMTANMVGFVVGLDGIQPLLAQASGQAIAMRLHILPCRIAILLHT